MDTCNSESNHVEANDSKSNSESNHVEANDSKIQSNDAAHVDNDNEPQPVPSDPVTQAPLRFEGGDFVSSSRTDQERQSPSNTLLLSTRLECKLHLMNLLRQLHAALSLDDSEFFTVYPRVSLATNEEGDAPNEKRTASMLSLLIEVTHRGGPSRVTLDRKWAEVASALNCNCFQGAGMVLRSYYDILLPAEKDAELMRAILHFDAHESGARKAGLPSHALTHQELVMMDMTPKKDWTPLTHEKERFLDARNHILQVWFRDCAKEIEFERDVLLPLKKSYGDDVVSRFPLLETFIILDTLGYINWGCTKRMEESFTSLPDPKRVKEDISTESPTSKKHVVVIGAGLAGLSCALQLIRFGHNVTIVEATNRTGGRVLTDRASFSHPADLGAMLITGIEGHPVTVLCSQLRQPLKAVSEHCPIYSLGEILDADLDARIENRFNDMLADAATKERDRWVFDQFTVVSQPVDASAKTRKRGRTREHTNMAHKPTQSSDKFHSKYSGVYLGDDGKFRVALSKKGSGTLEWAANQVFEDERQAARAHDAMLLDKGRDGYFDAVNVETFPLDFPQDETWPFINLPSKPVVVKCDVQRGRFGRPLTSAMASTMATSLNSDEPEEGDATPSGLKAIRHAKAVLEEVDRVIERVQKLKNDVHSVWVDDDKELGDADEDASLMQRMLESPSFEADYRHFSKDSRDFEDACLGWHFANLEYACATNLARVSAAHWDQDDEYDFEGAHVLLPNGFGTIVDGLRTAFEQHCHVSGSQLRFESPVAKIDLESNKVTLATSEVIESVDAVVCTVSLGVLKDNAIDFVPSLPDWKRGAIDRLGFGNLNKVVMEFDEVFWDPSLDIFGRVVYPDFGGRGEFYMFWALNRVNPSPMILALVAGDAADEQEVRSAKSVQDRALRALRETFPGRDIPEPKAFTLTRWRSDPYIRGSYSYVACGATGEDYSLLAEECFDGKLFFAGEATCREHPATTGGAIFSGLREAAKVASIFGRDWSRTGIAPNDVPKVAGLVKKARLAHSVDPVDLSPSQIAKVREILWRAMNAQFQTPSDFGPMTSPVDPAIFNPFRTPVDLLLSDRERAIRASQIVPRLPKDWERDRALWYVAERLGMEPAKEEDAVGCWI